MNIISEEEFLAWKQHPVTKALISILEAKRDTLRRQWEGGSFTDYSLETTALVNVGNLGTCRGYAFVAEFTYDDYLTELDDADEPEWAGTPRSGGTDQTL